MINSANDSNEFFLVKKSFTHLRDKAWATAYLTNYSHRLTNILGAAFSHQFWVNYTSAVNQAEKETHLLFRSKHQDAKNNAVVLTQIWRSKIYFDRFLEKVGSEVEFGEILKTYGLTWKQEKSLISQSDGWSEIQFIISLPHILQVATTPFFEGSMKVGDPFKVGDLCLPRQTS